MDAEALIRDYLRDLELEARRLVPDRAEELVGDVREHIDVAMADAGQRDEATVRNVLDRLGKPEAIAAAAIDDFPAPSTVADASVEVPKNPRRLRHRSFPWLMGAASAFVLLPLWFPMLVSYGFPTPAIPFLVPAGVLVVLVARRPGGLAFLSACLGVAGALAIGLALSVPLSCPSGEFSSGCANPRLAPIIAPALGLIVGGALLAVREFRGHRS